MELLQEELNKVQVSWKTHLIRRARSQSIVTGVPDELFYVPEIQGVAMMAKSGMLGKVILQGIEITDVMLTLRTVHSASNTLRESHLLVLKS